MDKVVVTYSWDSETHQDKVFLFVNKLRDSGYNAIMDLLVAQQETAIDFTKMMHQLISDNDKVIIILSPGYKKKAEQFSGGVGQEYQLIVNIINTAMRKFILVTFDEINPNSIPLAFLGREIVDLSKSKNFEKLWSKLNNQDIYEFNPVSAQKPIITSKKSVKRVLHIKLLFKDVLQLAICNILETYQNYYITKVEDDERFEACCNCSGNPENFDICWLFYLKPTPEFSKTKIPIIVNIFPIFDLIIEQYPFHKDISVFGTGEGWPPKKELVILENETFECLVYDAEIDLFEK